MAGRPRVVVHRDKALLAVPVSLLLAYALLRLSSTLFNELRDIVFVKVAQRAMRRIALEVFHHLHALSLRFHLDRATGGLTRDIERGTRGISTLLSYLIFSIIPVILEFALVAAVIYLLALRRAEQPTPPERKPPEPKRP